MPRKGLSAIASAGFPESDGLVARAGEDEVALGTEGHVGYVVVVAVQGSQAQVVVGAVPQLYGQVGGAGGQQSALLVVVDAVDGV
jgi:hypothetical protein